MGAGNRQRPPALERSLRWTGSAGIAQQITTRDMAALAGQSPLGKSGFLVPKRYPTDLHLADTQPRSRLRLMFRILSVDCSGPLARQFLRNHKNLLPFPKSAVTLYPKRTLQKESLLHGKLSLLAQINTIYIIGKVPLKSKYKTRPIGRVLYNMFTKTALREPFSSYAPLYFRRVAIPPRMCRSALFSSRMTLTC